MDNQLYCVIDNSTNVCINTVMWNGDVSTWTPPDNCLMLINSITPSKIWNWNDQNSDWELIVKNGAGSINFLWDGNYLITNESKPTNPPVINP